MATAFVIERDVAPPKGTPKTIYPFGDMKVGDSFFVPETHQRQSIQNAAYGYGIRKNKKFSIRQVEGGFRVWRTA